MWQFFGAGSPPEAGARMQRAKRKGAAGRRPKRQAARRAPPQAADSICSLQVRAKLNAIFGSAVYFATNIEIRGTNRDLAETAD